MRQWIVALVCAGVISGTYGQTAPVWTPHPVSIVLTVGHWLTQDSKKLYYVEVKSRARDFESAKAEGFRLAVEHAVGTLVLSETETANSRINRDDIITYASGYVDRFEITDRTNVGNSVELTMKVWVTHSAIANRLLNTSETSGQIDGERVATNIATITHERRSGDRIISTILTDFPKRSFDIELEPTKVIYDNNRRGQMKIEFYMRWNKLYLNSLAEALKTVNHNPKCQGIIKSCNFTSLIEVRQPGFSSNTQAHFNDSVLWTMFQQQLVLSRPAIQVILRDHQGAPQFKQCFYTPELDHSNWRKHYYVGINPGHISVNGDYGRWFNTYIDLTNLPVERLNRVELTVIRSSECI